MVARYREVYLQVGTEDVFVVGAPREVRNSLLGGCRVSEDTSPLLDGLVIVLGEHHRVLVTVIDLHARATASVTRRHSASDGGPVLGSGDGLAVRASAVPARFGRANREAAGGDTSICNTSLEKVGVCGSHNVLQTISVQ